MGAIDIFFRKNIKLAFSRVKEHILHIESEIKQNKSTLDVLKREIASLKEEVSSLRNQLKFQVETKTVLNPQNQAFQEVSSGNKGVYSFTHSFNKHSFSNHADIHSNKLMNFKEDFDKIFFNLSHQEFLTFLTIYQLEEEITNVSYFNVAQKLNLTEGCIRTYISSLLRKGAPIIKRKHNNKQVFLSILPEFRSLNLKQKLIDTFYKGEATQRTLTF